MYKTAICLIIFAIATITSGCCTTTHATLDPVARPVFSEYSPELWSQIPTEAQENIVSDDLASKEYIKRTEERIRIHNENSE